MYEKCCCVLIWTKVFLKKDIGSIAIYWCERRMYGRYDIKKNNSAFDTSKNTCNELAARKIIKRGNLK